MCVTQNSGPAVQALQSYVPLNLDKICVISWLVHESLWSELLSHFLGKSLCNVVQSYVPLPLSYWQVGVTGVLITFSDSGALVYFYAPANRRLVDGALSVALVRPCVRSFVCSSVRPFVDIFCPERNSKTIQASDLKLHRWIYLIVEKRRAQEP